VVLDQLARPRSAYWGFDRRLGAIVGSPALHLHGLAWLTQGRIAIVLLAADLVLGVAACTVRGARVFPALTLASAAVLLASPTFFPHYIVLIAAPGALTLGIGAARLGTRVRTRELRAAGLGILLAALVVVNLHGDTRRVSREIPYQVLTPAAARVPGCVTADDPVLLAAMNVLSRDYVRGCTVWPDVTGYTFDRDSLIVGGRDMPRARNPQWQRDLLAYLRSGDAVLRDRGATGLSPASRTLLNHTPVLASSGRFVLHATR
jgi:alpha-1,2-mannosyltransferase